MKHQGVVPTLSLEQKAVISYNIYGKYLMNLKISVAAVLSR